MPVESPAPSLESLTGTPLGSLVDSDPPRSLENSPPASTTGSVTGRTSPISTVCGLCNEIFVLPRVLPCLHVFCLGCLEKVYEGGDRISCPQCQVVSVGAPQALPPDYALHRILDASVDDPASCTACKSRDIAAVARCVECAKLLCPHCVMAHQFMHCFEGHRVVNLADLAQREERPVACLRHKGEPLKYFCVTCSTPICMDCTVVDHTKGLHEYEALTDAAPRLLEQICHAAEGGKSKALDLRTFVKSAENSAVRLQQHYDKAQQEIHDVYAYYTGIIEERKSELLRELESLHNAKQVSLSVFAQKAQECIDKLLATCDFVEKLKKYANSTEILMFCKFIEGRLADLMSKNFDITLQNFHELEFVSDYSAIQLGARNTFGYVRSQPDSQVGTGKLPPIARPTSSNSVSSMNTINNCLSGISSLSSLSHGLNGSLSGWHLANGHMANDLSTSLSNGIVNGISHSLNGGIGNGIGSKSPSISSSLNGSGLTNSLNGNLNGVLDRPYSNSQLSSLLSKRYNSAQSLSPFTTTALGDLNLNGVANYEKWSSGEGGVFSQDGLNGLGNSDPLHDISTKLLSCSIFPPRSQVKRHKMIYHCKFGEFGVVEGQFTEPSGVAVNAQNDIIVADTNNHRIQIFDKEGRFKFQFGECGKRDGQLLYPNRVAVVRTSGDIIVTERSPTHQIQIYNQYGQFVRKFGANTLCYPRGVTVDNKGRIIVVECKVMRVIIFDQYGTVLHQFNCPNHLEFPNGVVVNDKQEIFISDNRAHCVKVFNYEGHYLRQIGGEGITNYPIGVGINTQGEILIADNHNNFNLTLFTQDGQLVSAYESKVKHAQCFDVALMDDGSVVLASKDYRLYVYRYLQVPPPPHM